MSATSWTKGTETATGYLPANDKPGEFDILMETGDYILMETSDYIFLENYYNYGTTYTKGGTTATSWS